MNDKVSRNELINPMQEQWIHPKMFAGSPNMYMNKVQTLTEPIPPWRVWHRREGSCRNRPICMVWPWTTCLHIPLHCRGSQMYCSNLENPMRSLLRHYCFAGRNG
ncbi:hypothetical protein D3C76_1474220 [compost metagenome]